MNRTFVAVLFAFMCLCGGSGDVHAGFIPVFYERNTVLDGGSVLPLAADSAGDYFVLDPEDNELIILNNSLGELKRVGLPSEDEPWYNEIAVGPDDTVWVSSGYFSERKTFLQYDGNGNFLKNLTYENWRMAYVSNRGIRLDREGYLYFICSLFMDGEGISTFLYKLDPRDGLPVARWPVPVDGVTGWYRGLAINPQGEVLWGSFESGTIYKFSPQTGQTAVFAILPAAAQNNTINLSIDAAGNLYVLEQPSEFWRYDPAYLYLFDGAGSYRGRREVDFQSAGVGLATFEDEIVLSSYYTGIILKYTSICKNSVEYPYCIHMRQGVEELTQQYITLGRIKESDGQKILLELRKVAQDLQRNMIESAKKTLNQLIHFVGVKAGKTIDEDVAALYLVVLEQTRDNL